MMTVSNESAMIRFAEEHFFANHYVGAGLMVDGDVVRIRDAGRTGCRAIRVVPCQWTESGLVGFPGRWNPSAGFFV
jgi:hypothetical protein